MWVRKELVPRFETPRFIPVDVEKESAGNFGKVLGIVLKVTSANIP